MRFSINALALIALLIPTGVYAQAQEQAPACRADMQGDQLITTIEFADGYAVQAPWDVEYSRPATLQNGEEGIEVGASLDRIIEVDPATGERVVTPFPEPIETSFQAANEQELIYRAAQIWCLTVLKAQEQGASAESGRTTTRATAALPSSVDRADAGHGG